MLCCFVGLCMQLLVLLPGLPLQLLSGPAQLLSRSRHHRLHSLARLGLLLLSTQLQPRCLPQVRHNMFSFRTETLKTVNKEERYFLKHICRLMQAVFHSELQIKWEHYAPRTFPQSG